MDLIRITNPVELFACEKQVYPLFEKYYEKAKHYLENLETPDIAWKNCVNKSPFPDYYLYLLKEENEFVGFMAGCLLRMPYFTILFIFDYYAPSKGIELYRMFKQMVKILGVDEIWGESPDKVLNAYKRKLKTATIKKTQMVRIRL